MRSGLSQQQVRVEDNPNWLSCPESFGNNPYMDPLAIRTVDLGRTYHLPRRHRSPEHEAVPAEYTALDNVNLEIKPGELFGLLGSNGAGKTTLIKILTTLLAPTRGSAYVDGLDVVAQAQAVRERINMVSGGETS